MIPVFAVTTRGLEPLTAAEMQALGFAGMRVQYRRVLAECSDLAQAARLRTADDVFVHLDDWHGIGHTRAELPHLSRRSAALNLEAALSAVHQVRDLPHPITFSVTANFVGRRNYSVPEMKTQLARGILEAHPGWTYTEEDAEAALNLRVFLEHTEAIIGLRLLSQPLHRRAYKQSHLPGSLKPTVAAALLRMAGAAPGLTVLDPFCGAGTILIEAASMGLNTFGGDRDEMSLRAGIENARDAGVYPYLWRGDAARVPLAADSVDLAVTNPPWGRQIVVDESLKTLYRRAFGEMQRVVRPGGRIVLLTTLPDLIPAAPLEQTEISLFGQTPVILKFEN